MVPYQMSWSFPCWLKALFLTGTRQPAPTLGCVCGGHSFHSPGTEALCHQPWGQADPPFKWGTMTQVFCVLCATPLALGIAEPEKFMDLGFPDFGINAPLQLLS